MEKQQSRGAEQRRSKETKEQKSKGTEIHKKTKRDGKNPTKKKTLLCFCYLLPSNQNPLISPFLVGNRSCCVDLKHLKPPGHLDLLDPFPRFAKQLDIRAGGHLKARSFQTPQLDWQPKRAFMEKQDEHLTGMGQIMSHSCQSNMGCLNKPLLFGEKWSGGPKLSIIVAVASSHVCIDTYVITVWKQKRGTCLWQAGALWILKVVFNYRFTNTYSWGIILQ